MAVQVHRLATGLANLGHEVTIASTTSNPGPTAYRVIPIPYPPVRSPVLAQLFGAIKRIGVPWYVRAINTRSFDIIHIHGDGGFLKVKPNFVRTFHGTAKLEMQQSSTLKGKLAQWFSWRMEKRENRQYLQNGHAVGISKHIQQFLPAIKTVIPNMLSSPSSIAPCPRAPTPTLLYIGSINSRKQGEWAYAILNRLARKIADIRLVYVCKDIRKETAYVHKHYGEGLIPFLEFHQKIPEARLTDLYRRSWIYLSLSSYEGFGVPAIEAMRLGCVVASTNTPGCLDLFRHPSPILSIDKLNAEKVLLHFIQNPGKLKHRAELGKRRITPFKWQTVCKQYENLYMSVISGNGNI